MMGFSVEKYIQVAITHAENTLTGDYKAGNISASEIEKMNNHIADLDDDEIAYGIIDKIITSDCANAIMWIAPVCKRKRYKLDLIKVKLTNYTKTKSLGILALNAEMLLRTL